MTPDANQAGLGEWGWPFVCTGCEKPYEGKDILFCCPGCGGIYDFDSPLAYSPVSTRLPSRPGLDRYRLTYPLPPGAPLFDLGEGGTPLLGYTIEDRQIYFKCEHLNPTGSFKDRGTMVLVSALHAAGVSQAVEDSSGNAGASFAAYAARAGITARIYVPAYASGPKRSQIEAYGAEVVSVPGPRSAATDAVRQAADGGEVYASHAHLPHSLAGMATVAFEIVEQLGSSPGAVIMPVGQGTLFLGAYRGFQALIFAGIIDRVPQMVAVQAKACAPLWAVFTGGMTGLERVSEGDTIAEGIRISHPLRGDAILAAIEESGGKVVVVDEDAILAGRDALSHLGLYVEPTSAVVWPALHSVLGVLPNPVVAILTGIGFKSV
ncbi:MAG: pyridoxal-phosphate dependent enzyme [Anaerolineales bacterium]|nr:pyridoxal-phosphate dependent enzyme [Anaerolineales bacterium]